MTEEQKEKYRASRKARDARNKDRIKALNKVWRSRNKERVSAKQKEWCDRNKDKHLVYQKQWQKAWYDRNRDSILAKRNLYRQENREKILASKRKWNAANKDKCYAYGYKHRQTNKDKILARNAAWAKANRKKINMRVNKRKREDLNFSIGMRLRIRVCQAVRNSGKKSEKSEKTIELLGCSIESFRIYIESKFEPGMTWENIHLDHIIPCALFDLTKPEHQKICFHFSNYQPLFAPDNESKGAKILQPTQLGLPLSEL
jgi:hypothetical protein